MGGRPIFAINLVAFPDGLDMSILREILRGGAGKVAEAGAVIAGGHSVTDKVAEYGLAVTGIVHPDEVITKGGAQPGDVLVWTKPLGAGLVTTALKQGKAAEEDVETAVASMKTLNRKAAEAARMARATSMTDITGFGLLGHAHEMAHLGLVDFHVEADKLIWLPGAQKYAEADAFPGGAWRNRDYFAPWVKFNESISMLKQNMLFTPETSGGLLVSLPSEQVAVFLDHCGTAVKIGSVHPGKGFINVI
jgi:selenide,water dikinase